MSQAQPAVTGNLGKTPLLHVLVSLLERESTGTLVLETTEAVRSALYVVRGVPTKMRLGSPEARLSDVLIRLGYLKGAAADATYEKAVAAQCLHGQILVSDGLVDEELLTLCLRTQLVCKLELAAALPASTIFGFYEGTDYLAKWRSGPTPVSPLAAAWMLAQHCADPKNVALMTTRIQGHTLRLHRKSATVGFGFDRHEQAVIDVLRAKPQTLDSLERLGMLSRDQLERLAYVLTVTRHLDFGRDLQPLGTDPVFGETASLLNSRESLRPSRPVVLAVGSEACAESSPYQAKPEPPPATNVKNAAGNSPAAKPREAPPPTGPLDSATKQGPPSARAQERRAQLEKLGELLQNGDYFALLGLSRDANATVVQETFLKLAKLYHPDRLPEELADLRPLATRIFARLSEASSVLSDPVKRQAYLQSLEHGSADDEETKVRRVLQAASCFQRAEVLLKKRMLAAAELEATRALEDDPEQPDYLALYAWIQSAKPDSESRLPELVRQVSDAIARGGDSEKNRFYRVQILKRLGRTEEALADCRVIVERNPHHVDAQREIRLWEMRRAPQRAAAHKPAALTKTAPGRPSSSHPPAKPPSDHNLLGRLFKR